MSKLKVTTIADITDSERTDVTNVINGSAKAWVNFNGSGTVSIRRAFNVSSITDNGTGLFTLNFTNALVDGSYVMAGSSGNNTGSTTTGRVVHRTGEWTTTECQIKVATVSSTGVDDDYIGVSIFS